MKTSRRAVMHLLGGMAAAFVAVPAPASAQTGYPSRAVVIVAPFTPGGTTDLMARAIAHELQSVWGQSVVVENRPGAGGTLGAGVVARAQPDGYTLLLTNVGHAAASALYRNLSYDFVKDLDSITTVAEVPNILLVPKDSNIKDLPDLLARMRAPGSKISYGSAGIGTTQHLSGELLKSMAKVDALHVPYKGASPMMTDLIGGRIDFAIDSAGSAAAQIAAGYVRALAVTTDKRVAAFADLPTFAEAGVPGYRMTTWYGLAAPKGVSDEVKTRVVEGVRKALESEKFRATLANMAAEQGGMDTEAHMRFVRDEATRWSELIASSGTFRH